MKKTKITNELMSRFYTGDVTGEEFKKVLLAAEHDPDLKEEIEIMTSISDDLSKIRIKREDVSGAKVVSLKKEDYLVAAETREATEPRHESYLPMYKLAAQSKEYGHDMKAPNDCVVRCEQYILQQFNITTSTETLTKQSKDKGWMKDEGTPLHHIGRLLSEFHRLSVVRRYDCGLNDISQELKNKCKVIAVINADKLYGNNIDRSIPNHAVVVLSITNQNIRIYDPQHSQEETYPIDHFMFAWKDSHYYIVSITKRGVREYDPHPIDASSFKLSGDLEELMEAIAENAHDIWAKERQANGWSYGEKRDDEKKKHPDLVPYSDLTEKEKEYDRKMAQGTLELVQRLGYKIEKDK